MSNIEVSPEDRERLAKSKFGEWFDEFFEKKFEEAFEKKSQTSRRAPAPTGAPAVQGNPSTQAGQAPEGTHPPRRRSLLEECFSNTFGF